MIESIRTQLYSTISAIIPVNLSEAETEVYPYAAYEAPVEPVLGKDGVVRYDASTIIYIYAKDFDTVNTKAGQIITAMETSMRNAQYSATLVSEDPSRTEGIWCMTLTYIIRQYS